jgi:hypothetical protein
MTKVLLGLILGAVASSLSASVPLIRSTEKTSEQAAVTLTV